METAEHSRGGNGPMERSHMKDMVARNALESAAYNKMTKHLDNQKKAFVRQNTRDEEEMKTLLHRLQIEQHTTHSDDDVSSDDDNFDFVDGSNVEKTPAPSNGRLDPECTSNPYPVTIIPRFGGIPQIKQPFKNRVVIGRPGSSRSFCRRKSIEYEDIQEVLSSTKFAALSSTSEVPFFSTSNTNIHDENKSIGDWLAHPDAISSVRRMRKSVLDQSHRKVYRKLSNELCQLSEAPLSPTSSVSHSRSNSLKDRKRSNTISGIAMSPKPSRINRRGGSLKEHRTKSDEKSCKQFTLQELSSRKDLGTPKSISDPNGDGSKIKRKNSKKQTLQRKSSNESVTTTPPTSRKPSIIRRHDVGIEDCSPVGSPATKDNVFKY